MIDVATAAYATNVVVSQIDLDYRPYGANDIQFGISILVAFGVILVSSLFIKFASSRILTDEESEHATTISSGLRSRDWFKIRIPYDADVDDYRSRIRAGFDDDFEQDVPTVLEALREVRGVWRERRRGARDAVADEIPALSRTLSLDAVLYLVFGVVVHESLSTWGAIFSTGSNPPSPAVVVERIATVASTSAETLVQIAASYPFAGELWAFAFVGALTLGEFVYQNVYLVGGLLVAGSLSIWIGDRAVANDVEPRLYRTKPRAAFALVGLLASTWISGVVVAYVVSGFVSTLPVQVDANLSGSAIGLLASLVVAGLMARRTLRAAYDRLTLAYEQADDDGVGPKGTVAYIVVRKFSGIVGVLAASVLPIFVFEAVTSGKIFSIIQIAATESSTQVKATVAFVLLALVAFAVVQTRPAWGDLAEALRTSLDRQGLRIALLSRGFPLLVVVLTFPMVWGLGFFGPLESISIAVGAGIAVKTFFYLKTRAELAYFEYEDEPPKPGRVWVEGVVVEDARGREIAVVRTNGESIAAPVEPVGDQDVDDLPVGGLDALVDQAVTDTKTILGGYDPEPDEYQKYRPRPSVYAYYADRIREGAVDFEQVRAEYLGSIDKAIDAEVRRAGRDGIEVARLDEIMSREYDPDLYRRKRYEKQKKPDGLAIYGDRVKSN